MRPLASKDLNEMVQSESPGACRSAVDDIPETGLHLEIEAPETTLERALRSSPACANCRELSAVFDLTRRGAGVQRRPARCQRAGSARPAWSRSSRSKARSRKPVDLRFVPQADDRHRGAGGRRRRRGGCRRRPAGTARSAARSISAPSPPNFCILGIDPYPRKPGAEFAPLKVETMAAAPLCRPGSAEKGRPR